MNRNKMKDASPNNDEKDEVSVTPKNDKMRVKARVGSYQSTPLTQRLNYNVMIRHKNQTTAMKRRRKRDPTICRKGVDNMNPYCIIKDEGELDW